MGHLKRICKDACRVAGAETHGSNMLGGPGADFLRRVHFGASDLQVCYDDFVIGAALRMTWHHFFVAGAVL